MSGWERNGFGVSQSVPLLHDWLYRLVTEIIYDHDYAYLAYCKAFSAITEFIFDSGALFSAFEYTVYGIKSELDEHFTVKLRCRQNFIGFNEVMIRCDTRQKLSGETISSETVSFETSLGTGIETTKTQKSDKSKFSNLFKE
jgi:hypothetical protein